MNVIYKKYGFHHILYHFIIAEVLLKKLFS